MAFESNQMHLNQMQVQMQMSTIQMQMQMRPPRGSQMQVQMQMPHLHLQVQMHLHLNTSLGHYGTPPCYTSAALTFVNDFWLSYLRWRGYTYSWFK